MGPADLVALLRAGSDPLHLMAAEALTVSRATAERLQERVYQLEAIARLNGETIRSMQQATAEIERPPSAHRWVLILRNSLEPVADACCLCCVRFR